MTRRTRRRRVRRGRRVDGGFVRRLRPRTTPRRRRRRTREDGDPSGEDEDDDATRWRAKRRPSPPRPPRPNAKRSAKPSDGPRRSAAKTPPGAVHMSGASFSRSARWARAPREKFTRRTPRPKTVARVRSPPRASSARHVRGQGHGGVPEPRQARPVEHEGERASHSRRGRPNPVRGDDLKASVAVVPHERIAPADPRRQGCIRGEENSCAGVGGKGLTRAAEGRTRRCDFFSRSDEGKNQQGSGQGFLVILRVHSRFNHKYKPFRMKYMSATAHYLLYKNLPRVSLRV